MSIFSTIKQNLINAFYPKHIKCICCNNELSTKNVYDMCTKCYNSLNKIEKHFCVRCGLPFELDGTGTCLNCKSNNFHFNFARSAVKFENPIISAIYKFKYSRYPTAYGGLYLLLRCRGTDRRPLHSMYQPCHQLLR